MGKDSSILGDIQKIGGKGSEIEKYNSLPSIFKSVNNRIYQYFQELKCDEAKEFAMKCSDALCALGFICPADIFKNVWASLEKVLDDEKSFFTYDPEDLSKPIVLNKEKLEETGRMFSVLGPYVSDLNTATLVPVKILSALQLKLAEKYEKEYGDSSTQDRIIHDAAPVTSFLAGYLGEHGGFGNAFEKLND